jgi:branched-chain amino acid transport system substrate-binding protein
MIHCWRRSLMVGAVLVAASTLLLGLGTALPAGASGKSTSGKSTSGKSTSGKSTSGKSTSSSTPFTIGVICSCTGPEASSTATSAPTIEAWADAVNAKGGINGHKVQLVVKDDATNPGTSLSEVESMVSQDHVLAIFDNSDVDSAFEGYVAQHHVPVIGSYADSTAMYTNADFFPNGSTINWEPYGTVYLAKRAHATKLADLYCAEVAICKQATQAGEKVTAKAGLHTVYTAAIGFAAPNYTAQCLAAKESGATAMTVGDASAIVVKVAENCAQQGYKPIELSADGTVAEDWRTTPAMNGNLDIQPDIPFFVDSTPATKAMYAAIRKYEPSLASSQNFGEVVVEAWTSGLLFEAAARAAHLGSGATPAQVIKGLYDLHGVTLGGMAPPLTFAKNKPTTGIKCDFVMGIKNEKWTLPIGLKTICPS